MADEIVLVEDPVSLLLAMTEFLQHVVEAGQREVRMLGQHTLAMGVEFLGGGADGLFL